MTINAQCQSHKHVTIYLSTICIILYTGLCTCVFSLFLTFHRFHWLEIKLNYQPWKDVKYCSVINKWSSWILQANRCTIFHMPIFLQWEKQENSAESTQVSLKAREMRQTRTAWDWYSLPLRSASWLLLRRGHSFSAAPTFNFEGQLLELQQKLKKITYFANKYTPSNSISVTFFKRITRITE